MDSFVARSKTRRFKCALLALGLVLYCVPAGLALAKFEEEYAQAVAAYNKRDYSTSTALFWKSITDGNPTAIVWLYMAHSKAGEGRLEEAHSDYQSVVKIFKNSPESKIAAACVKALDAKTWHPGPAAGARAGSSAAKTVASSAVVPGASFRARIVIIAPRPGHPKVSAETIAAIKKAIDELPKSIYKILDEGGAKVNIGPNIIDKWPDSLTMVKPGQAELTLAEEPGRTYGRDIHIYERSIVAKGSTELGEARSTPEIVANFLHEIGHAVDDCLSIYSKDQSLQRQYKMDCDGMGDDARAELQYYLQPGDAGAAEACAESVCILLGGKHKESDLVSRNFGRTEAWVKGKLKL